MNIENGVFEDIRQYIYIYIYIYIQLVGGFTYFNCHPYLEKSSNVTNIFQMG